MKPITTEEDNSFSILMANYNNEKYIDEAIKSVLDQTYKQWELIIVDDNSTDNSISKIKPYLSDKRIKLIQHKNNLGYGSALRTAANNVSRDIIGILDADDKLYEKALEIMNEEYKKNPNYGFIYSNMWDCNEELNNCKVNTWIDSVNPEKSTILNPRISHFKTFKKSDYFKTSGFDPNQKRTVDKDIIYKLEEVSDFKFINIPLYYYRHHETGISQGKNEFLARVYLYIAKCKAYRRRLNKNIPNVSLKYLYSEYFKITFYKQIKFLKHINKNFFYIRSKDIFKQHLSRFFYYSIAKIIFVKRFFLKKLTNN